MPGAGRSPAAAGRGDAAPAAHPVTSPAASTAASRATDSRRRCRGPAAWRAPAERRRAFPAVLGTLVPARALSCQLDGDAVAGYLAAGRGRGHPGGVDPQVHRGRGGCGGAGRMGDRLHADEADQAGAAHGLPGGGGRLAGRELAFQRGSDQGRAQRQVRAGLVVHGVGARPRDVEGGGHRRGPGVVRARDADQRARRYRDAGHGPLACGGRARGRCPGCAAGHQPGGEHGRQPCPGQPPPAGASGRRARPRRRAFPAVPGRWCRTGTVLH